MRTRRCGDAEAGFVVRWVLGVVVCVSVLAVLIYDGAAIATNYFSLGNADDSAVAKVAEILQSSHSTQQPTRCTTSGGTHRFLANVPWCAEARAEARAHDAKLVTAYIDSTGVVHLTMRRTAKTLVLGRIGATKKWVTATVESQTITQ